MGPLVLAALGVVFGDLGTSPLYTIHACFDGSAMPVNADNVLGFLSLIFWALMLVVTVKYVAVVMRADNHGEGGILALLALARRSHDGLPGRQMGLALAGLIGAALFYGDGMITPAISVLSAVEGLEVATTAFRPFILPITLGVLGALFLMQRRGTQGIGVLFGPVMALWFLVLAVLGVMQIAAQPAVLAAVDPRHALRFFAHHGFAGFAALGAVVLALTGAEALYADMGHFGRRAIRLGWLALVLPALLLNYFGQGALLLAEPDAVANPFFRLVPGWGLLPLVALATAATVIASQAVISGAFSMTRQAIQLSYCPRLVIRHTSSAEIGQVYLPQVNWFLLAAVVALVLGFRSSGALAAAYGIAVTGTMVTTTLLAYAVMHRVWGWGQGRCVAAAAPLLVIDVALFGANLLKFAEGGWFPLLIAGLIFVLMSTWKRGRAVVLERLAEPVGSLQRFVEALRGGSLEQTPWRAPGTAIFLTGNRHGVPFGLRHNLRHNGVVHQRVVVLTVVTEDVPWVPPHHRTVAKDFGEGFWRLIVRYGFMEEPDVPSVLSTLASRGMVFDPERTTYFLGRETVVLTTAGPPMSPWRLRLFMAMSRNASSATEFFKLPADRVLELGIQVRF